GAAAAGSPVMLVPGANAGLVDGTVTAFRREDVLKPEILRGVFDAMDKSEPSAKAALSKARGGQLEGTALMALDAGDQAAGAVLRGLEFLSKGQLDPAATQFGVALRNAPDSALASFYLGACYAAAGQDKEAITDWERARANNAEAPRVAADSADQDKAKAVEYARAYAAAKGPNQALVDKWLQFLGAGK